VALGARHAGILMDGHVVRFGLLRKADV
jgi:hypothetical protein